MSYGLVGLCVEGVWFFGPVVVEGAVVLVGHAVGVGSFGSVLFGCFVPDFFAGVPVVVLEVGGYDLGEFWLLAVGFVVDEGEG